MALILREGDYVSDGKGGLRTAKGTEELLERLLWKLSVRRGSCPFFPELGSELHLLGRVPAGEREKLAERYVSQALAEEDVTVESVTLTQERERGRLTVCLTAQGESLTLTMEVTE